MRSVGIAPVVLTSRAGRAELDLPASVDGWFFGAVVVAKPHSAERFAQHFPVKCSGSAVGAAVGSAKCLASTWHHVASNVHGQSVMYELTTRSRSDHQLTTSIFCASADFNTKSRYASSSASVFVKTVSHVPFKFATRLDEFQPVSAMRLRFTFHRSAARKPIGGHVADVRKTS